MTHARRDVLSASAVVVGAVGIPVGAALPWVLSGQAKKSAFSLAKSARELGLARAAADLGIANESVVRAFLWTLFASPLVAGLIVLLLAFGQRMVVGIMSLIVGLIGAVGGAAGMAFSNASLCGPPVTLTAGVAALGGAVGLLRNGLLGPSPGGDS